MLSGIALAGYALAISACSASKPVPPPPPPTVSETSSHSEGAGIREQVTTVTAAVQKIDQKTRMITLKGPDGKVSEFKVSDDVKNLAQVHRGDWVTMSFYQAIAYQVMKKGSAKPGVATAADAATAPLGQKPGLVGGAAVTVTATIMSVDKTTNVVRIKGPKGHMASVQVQDPSRLEGIKAGDLVEITYTEALAISVDKAPKPSKKKS
jgi:Cu/Ag efflux protein CusF